MNELDLFLRGEGAGYFEDERTFYYLVKLDKVNAILYDYYDNYNNLSKFGHYADPKPYAFYIPEINTVVSVGSSRYNNFEGKLESVKAAYTEDIREEIRDKIEKLIWTRQEVTSLLTPEHVDKVYDDVIREKNFFMPFIKGESSLGVNLTGYYFSRERDKLNLQGVYEYLMNQDSYIEQKIEEFLGDDKYGPPVQSAQNEAVYQRYREIHLKENTFEHERKVVHILTKELKNAQRIWLHLVDGEKVQVENKCSIERDEVMVGRWREDVNSRKIVTIEYARKKYEIK